LFSPFQVALNQVLKAENVSDCRLIARLSDEIPIKKPQVVPWPKEKFGQSKKSPGRRGPGPFDVRIGRLDQ
jgi:hypothetical protein